MSPPDWMVPFVVFVGATAVAVLVLAHLFVFVSELVRWAQAERAEVIEPEVFDWTALEEPDFGRGWRRDGDRVA